MTNVMPEETFMYNMHSQCCQAVLLRAPHYTKKMDHFAKVNFKLKVRNNEGNKIIIKVKLVSK